MDNLPLVQFWPFWIVKMLRWSGPKFWLGALIQKIRSYEKNDRDQHAPYPWILSRVATFDLDLYGSTLKGLVPGRRGGGSF